MSESTKRASIADRLAESAVRAGRRHGIDPADVLRDQLGLVHTDRARAQLSVALDLVLLLEDVANEGPELAL